MLFQIPSMFHLLRSDGDITEGMGTRQKSSRALLDYIAELNHADMNVCVFTYAFGNSIESRKPGAQWRVLECC